jgi:uncharacterized membrane protein HdeD (DUF308 family)
VIATRIDADRLPAMTGTLAATTEDEFAYPFWLVLVLGISSALFGLAVLAWPEATVRVLAVLLGIWLLVIGVARIVSAFVSGRGFGRQLLSGLVGVIVLVGGIACLRDITKSVLVLAFLVALTWIFSGLAAFVVGLGTSGGTRVALIALGALSTALGLVFMVLPRVSLTVFVVLTGLGALVVGIAEIVVAFQVRRLAASS